MKRIAAQLALLTFLIAGGFGLYWQKNYESLKREYDRSKSECEQPGADPLCGLALAVGSARPVYHAEEMRNTGFEIAIGGPVAIGLFVLLWGVAAPRVQRGAKAGGRIAVDASRSAVDELSKRSTRAVGTVAKLSDSAQGRTRECPFCAEMIKPQAKVCRHCGKDVA